MPLGEVIIDDATWERVAASRRIEFETNIRELLDPATLSIREDSERLVLTVHPGHIDLDLFGAGQRRLEKIELPHEDLEELITEYVDIVRQIDRASELGRLNRIEALDMAKKVTHDRVGRVLKRRCRPFRIDHQTARRLFTLILSLRVDTTRLVGVHGHRRIR